VGFMSGPHGSPEVPTRASGAASDASWGLLHPSPDISRYLVKTRTALPFEGPFIEVSNLDERAGNAEAKL
jgi:hypothetical protein